MVKIYFRSLEMHTDVTLFSWPPLMVRSSGHCSCKVQPAVELPSLFSSLACPWNKGSTSYRSFRPESAFWVAFFWIPHLQQTKWWVSITGKESFLPAHRWSESQTMQSFYWESRTALLAAIGKSSCYTAETALRFHYFFIRLLANSVVCLEILTAWLSIQFYHVISKRSFIYL